MTSEQPVLRWDMMRARGRHKGRIVYRHMARLLRIVCGRMLLKALIDSVGPLPAAHDAHLIHDGGTRLLLSGYEH